MGAPNHVQHGFFDVAIEDRLSFHATRRAAERGIDLVWVGLVLRYGRAIRHLDMWRISLVGERRPSHVTVGLWTLATRVVVVESQSGLVLTVFRTGRGSK